MYEIMLATCMDSEKVGIKLNDISVEKNYRYLKFSNEIVASICRLLISVLNGMNIIKNCSFIKNEYFGKKIMRSEISIVDNPFIENNEVFFDAEGEELKIKKIISNGVLKECMNSKLSANVLNLSAGNSRYNYLLDTEVIEASNILFQYNTSSDSDYEYDAFIYKLFDNNLVMDSDTGYINFTCIGIDANKKM